jgi:small-conductance mechanosensitive channel
MRFKNPTRNYLLPADFRPAFTDEAAADAAFRVFDKDNNGDLSRAELKTTLMKVYKERRFLSRAMRDVGAALKTLDKMLVLFALIIQFFISLSIFGVDVTSSLTSVYTIGIGASFIFKSAASSAFDSIMFLFVTQ